MGMYENCLVAFVDMLGFREALRQPGRADHILQLLTTISGQQGESIVRASPYEGDSNAPGRVVHLRPAISAFSDNIVISYPLEQLAQHQIALPTAVFMLQNVVGYIAWNALNARLMVRGGIAIGQLYHREGVVFGPALLEAYDTEQHVAVYPRVAMGISLMQHELFPPIKRNHRSHGDGVTALDLMPAILLRLPPFAGLANTMVASWIKEIRLIFDRETARLMEEQDIRALAKWRWFETELNEALVRLPEQLLQDNPRQQIDEPSEKPDSPSPSAGPAQLP